MTRQSALARLGKTFRLWIVVYPTVLIVLALIGPHIAKLDPAIAILITTMIVVILVTNFLKPLADMLIDRLWRYAANRTGGLTDPILKQGQEK